MTDTLARSIRVTLHTSFDESVERFGPIRAALLTDLNNFPSVTVERQFGYRDNLCDPAQLKLVLIGKCSETGESIRTQKDQLVQLFVPIQRPSDSQPSAVLYFESSAENSNFHPSEIVAIESLAGRAAVDIYRARQRLLTQTARILPTSDQRDTWSGVRRSGMEAYKAGVADMALSFLERARDLAETWGPCQELAGSLNDYGQILMACQRLDEAGEQFERGLSILEQAGLGRDPLAVRLLNNLGGVRHANDLYSEALELYQLGLDIVSEQSKEDLLAPVIMANLGVVSAEMGDSATARIWLSQAVSSSSRVFGEDHPNTARCRARLEELVG